MRIPPASQQPILSLKAHLSTLLLNGTSSLPEGAKQPFLNWCCFPCSMVLFAFIFVHLFLIAAVVTASPHRPWSQSYRSTSFPTFVETPIGIAQGTTPISGVSQFAVKYASARRWQNPVVMGTWELPYASPTQRLLVTNFLLEMAHGIQWHSQSRAPRVLLIHLNILKIVCLCCFTLRVL